MAQEYGKLPPYQYTQNNIKLVLSKFGANVFKNTTAVAIYIFLTHCNAQSVRKGDTTFTIAGTTFPVSVYAVAKYEVGFWGKC